jgi:hypothetical protein
MHNFVLACPSCNRSKSDSLAAKVHLDKWVDSTARNSNAIIKIGDQVGISSNLDTSIAIAKWGYETASKNNSVFWAKPGCYETL